MIPNPQNHLNPIKKNWETLVTSATWLIGITTSIIIIPNEIRNGPVSIKELSIFVLAVIIGLSLILTNRFKQKSHQWVWSFVAILFLLFALITIQKYNTYARTLICNCDDQKFIRGNEFLEENKIYLKGIDPKKCPFFCDSSFKRNNKVIPSLIWEFESIEANYNSLLLTYIGCLPLISLTIISISQAVNCAKSR